MPERTVSETTVSESFRDPYQQKLLDSAKLEVLMGGCENLILGMGVAMPCRLLEMLEVLLRKQALDPFYLYYMHGSETLQKTLLQPEWAETVNARPLFLSAHDRVAQKQASVSRPMEFVPASFHQVGRLLTEHLSPDCFMVTVSPMDRHGYFSLGTNADYGASVVRKARKVIVEVNEHMPRTFGECTIHLSEIDYLIDHSKALTEVVAGEPNGTDQLIAARIAERIRDEDTIQMGVGGVPNAVLARLKHHQNLGLHSELFSPEMAKLIEKGVITGKKKSWMQHKHVFTLALGDRAMYDFMDDNPAIVGYPASWVNNPSVIAKNRNMVSVNAAIEIDLSGQVNAEALHGRPFSGTGGQLDFVRGAYQAENGRSFIALHSTAKQGAHSRIVPTLKGGAVTDTRMDTHYVVTEYGCVNLKGKSLVQRAQLLIELAHPSFRQELEKEAIKLGILRSSSAFVALP